MWLQGKENAPDIVQACFNSHKRLKGYKCIVLSEETINEYITLPVHIWEKYKKGIIGKAHFADIVRTVLLCEYGGIWCDSTCYYSGDGEMPGYIEDSELFLFSNKTNGIETSIISNWFIRAHSDSILLNAVKDMLFEYWRRHNKAVHYFFYHFLFKIATEVYPDEWRNVPYINNLNPHILQLEMNDRYDEMRYNYICSLGVFHKLTYIKDMQEGSFVDCIIRKEVGNARKQ